MNKDYRCLHNECLFNGWDADIIIKELKLAILWNGSWHYREMNFNNHSLKQVQNRDRIKLKEIKKLGWKFIIVKDYDSKIKPVSAYKNILYCIKNNIFNIEIEKKNKEFMFIKK